MTRQKQFIRDLHDQLVGVLPAGSVALLYGSQARGEARPDSNWDILIIVDREHVTLAENAAITYPIVMYGWTKGIEVNPILYTRKEWEANRHTPFAESVERDAMKIA